MRFIYYSLLLTAMAFVAGCTSSAPGNRAATGPSVAEAAAMAGKAGMSSEEIRQATKLYILKCARCHKFYDPADYGETEWQSWMTKMARKARLKPDQNQLLATYLGALRQKPSDSLPPF